MGESSDAERQVLPRQKFSASEDEALVSAVSRWGACNWQHIAQQIPGRTARQCRDRFANYLAPSLTQDPWAWAEDRIILDRFNQIGPHWSQIAHFLPGRSANAIKNRWYTYLHNNVELRAKADRRCAISIEIPLQSEPPPPAVPERTIFPIADQFLSMVLNRRPPQMSRT
jgi:hypothetical protein